MSVSQTSKSIVGSSKETLTVCKPSDSFIPFGRSGSPSNSIGPRLEGQSSLKLSWTWTCFASSSGSSDRCNILNPGLLSLLHPPLLRPLLPTLPLPASSLSSPLSSIFFSSCLHHPFFTLLLLLLPSSLNSLLSSFIHLLPSLLCYHGNRAKGAEQQFIN